MKKAKRIPAGITQPDILMEILSCLPVKSLLQFRCVSKTWLALISSPHFVKIHINRSIQINPKILFSANDDIYTIDYQRQPPYYPEPNDFDGCDQLIRGSCNGVLCVSDNEDGYMALWNPATKEEEVEIPYPHVGGSSRDVVMGFGYDPVKDEYKIVSSVFHIRDFKRTEFYHCEVKVCTLGTGEWRTVNDPPCYLRDRHMPPLVDGALHWLGGSPIGSNTLEHKIVSFHIRSEEFRVVPWIVCTADNADHDTTIGVLQGCLSALTSYGPDLGIQVWVMKDYGVKESWTQLFSVKMPLGINELSKIEPLVLRENGEMILKSGGQLYVYDGMGHTLSATHHICGDRYSRYAGHTYSVSDENPSWGNIYDSGDDYPIPAWFTGNIYDSGDDYPIPAWFTGNIYLDSDDDPSSSCYAGHIYAESLVSIKALVGQWNDEDSPWSSEEED